MSKKSRWIYVSERLPKDGQRVIVTVRSGRLMKVDTCIFHHSSPYWEYYVVAWKPFPEPCKAERKVEKDGRY